MGSIKKYLIYLFHIFLFCQSFAASTPATKCLDESGTEFLPSAQACENIRDDAECMGIFRASVIDIPAQVDINCPNPIMEVVANQCAKRCGLCCEQPEFSCGDDESM